MINENKLQKIISHAKEYGFIFPSSEIYEGLAGVYDYGQWGVELKNNIKNYWWKWMTQMNEQNIVGIDTSILMNSKVWKASGHIDNFSDPMIDNKDSKKRYRVDHLIEEYAESLDNDKKEELLEFTGYFIKNNDFDSLKKLIIHNNICCPFSKTCNWSDIRQFNLMFSTEVGSISEEAEKIYLRPETAQGIFVNFLNVQKTSRMKIPFGIAQIGKAFRNEIVTRGFIFRMREFEQMEMQFFVRPNTQKYWFEYWKKERLKWHLDLGISINKYRYQDHDKLAHYADDACDIEFEYPMGFKEIEGIHSRTDFDLRNHQELSNKKILYFDAEKNPDTDKPYGNYIPYVIETSIGLDRCFLSVLCDAYTEENLDTENKNDNRIVLKISPKIAPIKLAVLPLMKKDGLPEIALNLMDECKKHFKCFYEEKDTIGKRYRRMDAIGTPFCVTIDYQTKEDDTVTIRYRDSMLQERIPITDVLKLVNEKVLL